MENLGGINSPGLNNRYQAIKELRDTLNKTVLKYGSINEQTNKQNDQKTTQSYISVRKKKNESARSTGIIVGGQTSKKSMTVIMHKARVNKDLAKQLCELNAKRGGKSGFKGFLFEHLHAANETANGILTMVINDNGVADFVIKKNGRKFFAQAKVGQANGNINFAKYKGQTLIVDKGNTALAERARQAGMKVVESDISNKQVTQLGKTMQLEQKITGNKNAVVTSKAYATTKNLSNAHRAGIQAAKSGAQFGAGLSIGSNLVDVITGEKELKEAVKDVAVDTAISAGTAYVAGAAVAAVAQTAAGAAVAGVATTAGAAIAATSVGGAAMVAGAAVTGAVTGTVAAATASTVVAASAVTSAVASTAVGGTIAAAGTAIAGTAVGGAVVAAGAVVGAAAVAAAPIIIPAIAIGAAWKIGKKLFSRKRW
ncbi:hypothetical protein GC096_30590 [Paenibacillus sp. LMG 31461]|uniref:Uncharacterized protein n=1 Tax=Paenibacillus plantarum TaxID=2654975 RepID=A0ABX1XKF6_9BACL|nr:hypothetical protein [Paenibacillus plantarum]NOU68378.1 hypothetical protein [Paenibacillus plantarum]